MEGRSVAYNDEVAAALPRRVRGLPTRRLLTEDRSHPTVKVEPAAPGTYQVVLTRQPCH
jgi:hypothetical protein